MLALERREKMLELAQEKLKYARILLENRGYADSVSRAYFAMFNAAKAMLLTEDSSPRTHQGVNSELGNLFQDRIDRELLREYPVYRTGERTRLHQHQR